jgi:hypothetical protein
MTRLLAPVTSGLQVNVDSGGGNGLSGNQNQTDVTVLSDGRFMVAYSSDYFGNGTDREAVVRIFNADGTPSSLNYLDVFNAGGDQTLPAIAARLDGGAGVVFSNTRHENNTADANGPNINYRTVSATGVLGPTLAIGDFDGGAGHDALSNPAIATLSTGRQVVVFERTYAAADHDIFLNVVNAAGTATQFSASSALSVAGDSSWQANPNVAASGNNALVVYENATGTTQASANISARFFFGATNTLGAEITIADHAGRLFTPGVIALDDHRYVIVYGDQNDLWARIYDTTAPAASALSAEVQVDATGGFALNPDIDALPGGGFVVTWANWNGADYDVRARVFSESGTALGSDYIIPALTNSSQYLPALAVSGHNIFFGFEDYAPRPGDINPTSVAGRVFSITDPALQDFNGDGRSDVMLRHTSGQVSEWQMNGSQIISNAAVASLGNEWRYQDTGDFNGNGFSDVMWRHTTGQVVLWQMNGNNIVTNTSILDVSNQYHVQGIGDFGGDGRSDVLFRHDSGQVVLWQMNGDQIASNTAINSVSTQYHIEGVGDFNGDHRSDVLLRHDTGQVVMWRMNGDQIIGNTAVGTVSQDYTVQGVGDFNADGNSDVLWRHSSGQIVLWQMNGDQIVSNTQILNVSNQYQVQDVRDYNGDGMSDVLLRHDTGQVVLWTMNGDQIASNVAVAAPGNDWTVLAPHFDLV